MIRMSYRTEGILNLCGGVPPTWSIKAARTAMGMLDDGLGGLGHRPTALYILFYKGFCLD